MTMQPLRRETSRVFMLLLIMFRYDSIIKYFLEFGAGDLYQEDNKGKSPADYAPIAYQQELQGLLT